MKLNDKQLSELIDAQARCYVKWGRNGMARVMQNNTKEVGTLILPEVHEKVTETYTVVHGFRVIASGTTWQEVLAKAGI